VAWRDNPRIGKEELIRDISCGVAPDSVNAIMAFFLNKTHM